MTIDLEAIKARADAATEPTDGDSWVVEKSNLGHEVFTGPLSETSQDVATYIFHAEDAEFIAAARTDVPVLVELVREGRDRLEEAEREVERLRAIERRADRFRAIISGWAISAHAPGNWDWERRFLDALHADDRTLALSSPAGPVVVSGGTE